MIRLIVTRSTCGDGMLSWIDGSLVVGGGSVVERDEDMVDDDGGCVGGGVGL